MHIQGGEGRKSSPSGSVLPFARRGFCFVPHMNSRVFAFVILVSLLCPLAWAGGKKDVAPVISFHFESDATDNPKMIFQQAAGGKMRFFGRTPDVNSKDIAAFAPFPSDDGGYGVLFVLKEHAGKRLAALTNANQGRFILSILNGRVVDGVQIDKPVEDGKLVVWKGVTLADIALLDESLPRVGQDPKKKKKKD